MSSRHIRDDSGHLNVNFHFVKVPTTSIGTMALERMPSFLHKDVLGGGKHHGRDFQRSENELSACFEQDIMQITTSEQTVFPPEEMRLCQSHSQRLRLAQG